MKERPILFSGPMVRAILEGRKTMTRRVVKHNVVWLGTAEEWNSGKYHPDMPNWETFGPQRSNVLARLVGTFGDAYLASLECPHGKPGDRLWVRETWQTHCEMDAVKPSDLPVGTAIQYPATYDHWVSKKRPSIFLPRWASRVTLEITNVRVELLNQISRENRIAEGVTSGSAVEFAEAWDKVNGKKHPWESNPWVWVIEFKKV